MFLYLLPDWFPDEDFEIEKFRNFIESGNELEYYDRYIHQIDKEILNKLAKKERALYEKYQEIQRRQENYERALRKQEQEFIRTSSEALCNRGYLRPVGIKGQIGGGTHQQNGFDDMGHLKRVV